MDSKKTILRLRTIPRLASLAGCVIILITVGFDMPVWFKNFSISLNLIVVYIGLISIFSRYFSKKSRPSFKVFDIDVIFTLYIITTLIMRLEGIDFPMLNFLRNDRWLNLAVILVLIRELFALRMNLKYKQVNTAQVFIFSFLIIILLGSFMLMLPNATTANISYLEALFTSTSAVCVTGLAVVDTATFFTPFGQGIILFLIQIGGLGILTFVSYFSYFFMGNASYESHMVLSEMTNNETLGEVFNTLKKIIIVTFSIELLGFMLIMQSIDNAVIPRFSERVFFSAFHSISSFCNAGFSTLSSGLYESTFKYNYTLHLIVAALIILGGIGFPIIFNLWRYIKNKIFNLFKLIVYKKRDTYRPWVLNLNSKIILMSTLMLILFGMIFIYILEYNNTLADHGMYGKIVTAFFGSVTTRTAGFNTVDMSALTLPTVMIFIFLMWIGASPASTGGGIKTSTMALALLNILSLAKGKERVEIYGREISQISINKAFTIIILSIIVISLSVFGLVIFDAEKGLMNLIFESVSAYSTVGLTRGITAELSNPGKIIIIATMFIGRVSMLTVLIAFVKKVAHKKYSYPTEEILIN